MPTRFYDHEQLRLALARRGTTHAELATACRLHICTIYRLMNGQTQRVATVRLVASVLGVALDDLILTDRRPASARKNGRVFAPKGGQVVPAGE